MSEAARMPLAWDTETRSFRWWENPAFLVSWAKAGGQGHTAPLPASQQHSVHARGSEFIRALGDTRHVVGANAKFDLHMTRESLNIDLLDPSYGYEVDDVLMMSRLLYGARRTFHGLKELATDFIDPAAKDAEKAMSDRYYELTGKSDMNHDDSYYTVWQDSPELVEHYAALDAEYTLELYRQFKPRIDEDAKLASLYQLERKVQTVLYEAEHTGVAVDPEAVERLSTHYQAVDLRERHALEQTLGFVPEGEGSAEALREGLQRAGVPLTEVTEKSGQLRVDRKALAPYSDHPAVAALFEWRRANKFLQTYIGPLAGRDVVHPNFKQAEAWTGRMACASPNMQNIPKRTEVGKAENLKVRSVFVPRPGMEFIVADFDAIEMRILAYYLGVPAYRREIHEGDPHAKTAAAIWPHLGDWTAFIKGTPNRWLRDVAKQDTYGIVYGGGGPVVMDTTNRMMRDAGHPELCIDLDQARGVRRKITNAIPGFKEFTASPWKGRDWPRGALYEQLCASVVEDGENRFGYVRTLLGRKQWVNLDKAYVALSALIQGSAADIMKAAAVNLREALKPYGGYPLLFVHDEAVCEVPKGWGQRLVPVVEEAMCSAATIDPPLTVEAHVTDRSWAHV